MQGHFRKASPEAIALMMRNMKGNKGNVSGGGPVMNKASFNLGSIKKEIPTSGYGSIAPPSVKKVYF